MAHFIGWEKEEGIFQQEKKKFTKLAWFMIMNSCASLYQREDASFSIQTSAFFAIRTSPVFRLNTLLVQKTNMSQLHLIFSSHWFQGLSSHEILTTWLHRKEGNQIILYICTRKRITIFLDKDCHKIGVISSGISTNLRCFLVTLLQRTCYDPAHLTSPSQSLSQNHSPRLVPFCHRGS